MSCELPQPGADIDLADPNSTTWNAAACGIWDAELTAVQFLVVAAAEIVVQREFLRWCGLDTDGDDS